jgi:ATP-dependent DNA helicase RecQ
VPRRTSVEILAGFAPERAAFLRGIFACAKKNKKWFTLNVVEAVEKTGADRDRVVAALSYLEEQGDLELQAAGVRRGFRIVRRLDAAEGEKLAARLQERFQARENNDIQRLRQVVSLVRHNGCKTNYLLNYFGERHPKDCGHCEYCLSEGGENRPGAELFSRPLPLVIAGELRKRVRVLRAEAHEALASARQQARFFCGISSPRASRGKLHQHGAFGMLQHFSFVEVLLWLENTRES